MVTNRNRTVSELAWTERFNQLLAFKKKYKHVNVPARWPANKELGHWVVRQRQRKDLISKEQKSRLDSINFIWDIPDYNWNENYEKLVQLHKKGIAFDTTKDKDLKKWLRIQRNANKRKQPLMTDERKKKLNQLGFLWVEPENAKWTKNFEDLKEFKKRFKHTAVPFGWEENPTLAAWVSEQRKTKQRVSAERLKKLNSINFLWSIDFAQRTKFKKWNKGR